MSNNNPKNSFPHNLINWIVERLPALIHRESGGAINYLVATALVGIALLVRLFIAPVDAGLQYVAFFPAVTLAAVIGGLWPGLFATILGLSLGTFIFTFPYYSLSLEAVRNSIGGNFVFLMDGIIVCSSIEAMHRYRARYAKELDEIKLAKQFMQDQQERINGLVEAAMDIIISTDENQNIIMFNHSAERMFGYSAEEIIGQPLEKLLPQRFRETHGKHVTEFGMTGITKRSMNHLGQTNGLRANGEEFPFEATISRITIGGRLIYTAILRDVTLRKQADKLLRESEERYRVLFENMIDGYAYCKMIFADDKPVDFVYLNVNSAFEKLTGLKNVTGKKVSEVIPGILESNAELIATYGRVASTGVAERFESYVEPLGTWFFVTVYSQEREYFVAIFENITDRKNNEELINKMAFYDTLTQLPNRRMFSDRLGQAMAANKRSAIYGAVLFMDLDNFKPLNDTHGHAVGDLLLIEVARRISSCVREMDTVARFGGDEFVVMLSELDVDQARSRTEASVVAEKIRACLAETYVLASQHSDGTEISVAHQCTSSIGVTLFMNHGVSQDEILLQADVAMYLAKESGRNLIRFYEPGTS